MLNLVAKKVYAQSFYAQSCFTVLNSVVGVDAVYAIAVVRDNQNNNVSNIITNK